ncbi:MAG TPA: hypothetical protein VMM18_01000 [Gemmatimonadaceae bacterium]|nr:hypothetical protein [Gemmatimonadaceae bacterium]
MAKPLICPGVLLPVKIRGRRTVLSFGNFIILTRTTGAEPPPMARKPNYGFEKRKKEQDRKAKKDAKRADRQQRRGERQEGEGEGEGDATDPSPSPEDSGQPDPKGSAD